MRAFFTPRFQPAELQLVGRQHTPDTTFQQADESKKTTFTLSVRRSQESKETHSLRAPRAFHKLFVFQLPKRGIHCSNLIAHKRCDLIRAGKSYTVTVHES
jgi:hypothetical protein